MLVVVEMPTDEKKWFVSVLCPKYDRECTEKFYPDGRSVTMRVNCLCLDRPDLSFASGSLARGMKSPATKTSRNSNVLGCMRGRPVGAIGVLEVFCDADHAGKLNQILPSPGRRLGPPEPQRQSGGMGFPVCSAFRLGPALADPTNLAGIFASLETCKNLFQGTAARRSGWYHLLRTNKSLRLWETGGPTLHVR